MSIIRTADPDEVTGLAAQLYEEDLEDLGYVPAHTRVMATNPDAVRAYEALIGAISSGLGARRYELVTLAAAKAIGSNACRLAHGRKSLSLFDEDQLERIARDHHDAGLSDAEVELMDFAARLSTAGSASMTDDDTLRLRSVGFTDREIVDIALAASARNYYSRALHALCVEVDVPPELSTRLREALTVPEAPRADADYP